VALTYDQGLWQLRAGRRGAGWPVRHSLGTEGDLRWPVGWPWHPGRGDRAARPLIKHLTNFCGGNFWVPTPLIMNLWRTSKGP
jgi:hypothetical protein